MSKRRTNNTRNVNQSEERDTQMKTITTYTGTGDTALPTSAMVVPATTSERTDDPTAGQDAGTGQQEETPRTYVNQNSSNAEILGALLLIGVRVSPNLTRDALIARAEEEKIWEQLKRSVVPDSFKTKYGAPQNCGDELAEILKNHDPVAVCLQNGIDPSRWAGKNPGMFRMNLGNVLRGRVRRGDYVVVGDAEWNIDAKPESDQNVA